MGLVRTGSKFINFGLGKGESWKSQYCPILRVKFKRAWLNFLFCFRWFQKFTAKFWSLSDWFKICKFWTWQWRMFKKSILPYFKSEFEESMTELSLSLSMILKVYRKILVSFRLVQNSQILDLAIAKVEKVNIALFYEWIFRKHDIVYIFFLSFQNPINHLFLYFCACFSLLFLSPHFCVNVYAWNVWSYQAYFKSDELR